MAVLTATLLVILSWGQIDAEDPPPGEDAADYSDRRIQELMGRWSRRDPGAVPKRRVSESLYGSCIRGCSVRQVPCVLHQVAWVATHDGKGVFNYMLKDVDPLHCERGVIYRMTASRYEGSQDARSE